MKGKIFNHIKKVIIVALIIMTCGTNVAYGFSIGNEAETTKTIRGFITRIFKQEKSQEQYSLANLEKDLKVMEATGNIDIDEIKSLIEKLPNSFDKELLKGVEEMFSKLSELTNGIDLEKLLETLLDAVSSLIGGLGGIIGGTSSALPVEAEDIYLEAKTAKEFTGTDEDIKLHANIYKHVNENGEEDSDKWALLVHPFMLKGETIAGNVGPFYYEKGYNIIAPDLRGFGDSEGSVALGCLESMDIYDWLVKLNKEYEVSEVIVHGISLGAATTNYLSGIHGFINNGPTKIETEIKPIRELNVVGLVEDCGYVDMTEFADKGTVMSYSGLAEENFDYYSKATNSLKYCDLPMLIIHGTSDSTVDPENAEIIKNTVKGDVEVWMVDGGAHAFIIMGSNKEEYKVKVQEFIDKNEKNEKKQEPVQSTQEEYKQEEVVQTVENVKEKESFIQLVKRLLAIGR